MLDRAGCLLCGCGAPIGASSCAGPHAASASIESSSSGSPRPGTPTGGAAGAAAHSRLFHGFVAGIGSASGSATALLPADNATGNFVKVVQLGRVRIESDHDPAFADGAGDARIPVGVSAEVAIQTTRHPRAL